MDNLRDILMENTGLIRRALELAAREWGMNSAPEKQRLTRAAFELAGTINKAKGASNPNA